VASCVGRSVIPAAIALTFLTGCLIAVPSEADEPLLTAEPPRARATETDDVQDDRVLQVSPTGDDDAAADGDGPFRTLARAFDELGPGDTLVVHDGEYRESVRLVVRPGRSDAPIRVRPARGARPVIRGLLSLRGLSWWQIEGINVTWDSSNRRSQHMVKLIDGQDWSFTRAELWGARSYAALLVAGSPARFRLSELYVHDTLPSNGLNQDHLLYLNCGDGGGTIERNLLVGSHNGRAIKIGSYELGGPRVANITIRYNTMVDNTGPSNIQFNYRASGVRVYRNIMVRPEQNRPNVTAFELRGSDNVIEDNVGFGGSGVLEAAVAGFIDGGGNRELDPQLSGRDGNQPFKPAAPEAQGYGRWAD
jgi:hypothetical protein